VNLAEFVNSYLVFILLASAAVFVTFLMVRLRNRRTSIVRKRAVKDVLDEGAARASRNQILIDQKPQSLSKHEREEQDSLSRVDESKANSAQQDDLTRIKGLGPKIEEILKKDGIFTFRDIAQWNDADIERVDKNLGKFQGRIQRDKWVEQARLLIEGDEEKFSKEYGKSS
jgi:predicted flap endonuclease-1-like 5' DNA nuclease